MPTIRIDTTLYEKTFEIAEKAGYGSVDEFVTHLLETATAGIADDATSEDVLERLRGLGYIS